MPYADRTTLNNLSPNLQPNQVASSELRLKAFQYLYQLSDENFAYIQSLVTSGTLSPLPPEFLYRQAIINGNFDIWQRGTSFTVTGAALYTADRWQINSASASRQAFAPGQTEVPNNPDYFLRYDCSLAPSDPQLSHRIENVGLLAGKTVTISFWAKASAAVTFSEGGYFTQNFGSGGSPTVSANIGAFSLTTAWQRIVKTVTLPAITGKTVGANNFLELRLDAPNATSIIFDIAQVQLNVGDVPLPFQPRSFAEELALCQRYFEKSYNYATDIGTAFAPGYFIYRTGDAVAGSTAGSLIVNVPFKVRKRTSPTVTLYGVATGAANAVRVNFGSERTGATLSGASEVGGTSISLDNTSATAISMNQTIDFHYTADAEL